jgi:hypothetical protein
MAIGPRRSYQWPEVPSQESFLYPSILVGRRCRQIKRPAGETGANRCRVYASSARRVRIDLTGGLPRAGFNAAKVASRAASMCWVMAASSGGPEARRLWGGVGRTSAAYTPVSSLCQLLSFLPQGWRLDRSPRLILGRFPARDSQPKVQMSCGGATGVRPKDCGTLGKCWKAAMSSECSRKGGRTVGIPRCDTTDLRGSSYVAPSWQDPAGRSHDADVHLERAFSHAFEHPSCNTRKGLPCAAAGSSPISSGVPSSARSRPSPTGAHSAREAHARTARS